MGERSRFSLPSLGIVPRRVGAPGVDEARAALGGRIATDLGAGACVRVSMKRGGPAFGVLVCLHGDERDVWIGDGRFVRVASCDVTVLDDADPALAAIAADAERFGALREGDAVTFVDRRGGELEGTLVEKCRYGGLVSGEAGKIIAVSFRRLAPRSAS